MPSRRAALGHRLFPWTHSDDLTSLPRHAYSAASPRTLVDPRRAGHDSEPGRGGEFKLGERTLRVPEGFVIEPIAGPPLVDRPIIADFDEQGRLYVADSSGSNDNVQKQLAEQPHRIVRLEDSDGDGRFDTPHRLRRPDDVPRGGDVARRLALRRGAAEHLEADRHRRRRRGRPARASGSRARRSPAAPTTCTAPTSAPTAGSTGARGRSPSRPTSGPASRRSSPARRTSSAAGPTASGIEPVMTGGMDNPVDVVFTPGGERIFTTHLLPAPRRRPARRPDPRDLRRHLRQGPRPDLRAATRGPAPTSCRCCCTWARPPRAG